MQIKSLVFIAVLVMVALTIVVLGLLIAIRTIPNTVQVKAVNVSVWQDNACTIPLSSWDWGLLEPGGQAQKTMYVKNDGNAPVTLNMTTTSWSPSNAASYLTVTWNREGAVVPVGNNVQANVSLAVSSSITGIPNVSFSMVITGTG